MTIDERTEGIIKLLDIWKGKPAEAVMARENIKFQIELQIYEAVVNQLHVDNQYKNKCVAEAYDKAADIAEEICPDEEYGEYCHTSIPRRIREQRQRFLEGRGAC